MYHYPHDPLQTHVSFSLCMHTYHSTVKFPPFNHQDVYFHLILKYTATFVHISDFFRTLYNQCFLAGKYDCTLICLVQNQHKHVYVQIHAYIVHVSWKRYMWFEVKVKYMYRVHESGIYWIYSGYNGIIMEIICLSI